MAWMKGRILFKDKIEQTAVQQMIYLLSECI